MDCLDKNNIFSETKHDFCKKQCCEGQLVVTRHDFAKSLGEKKSLDLYLIQFCITDFIMNCDLTA